MAYMHLGGFSILPGRWKFSNWRQTDCLSYFFCSLRLITMRASRFCFFFSSCSSACCFSLACCFFSISVRRFCAVDDELWDNVPSRAPNNLCPRLRSSNCPLRLRSDCASMGVSGGEAAESLLLLLSLES